MILKQMKLSLSSCADHFMFALSSLVISTASKLEIGGREGKAMDISPRKIVPLLSQRQSI